MATSDAPADQSALHDSLLKVLELNPQFAPAYIQLAELSMRRGDPKSAYGLSRKAEELEPWRAGYHLLTGEILLRMGDGANAATSAQYVAEGWFGSDHNEAVELWNAVPASQRPAGQIPFEEAPKDTQTVSGIMKSLTCDNQNQTWAFVLDQDGHSLAFGGKGYSPPVGGFTDTIWYGKDHFNACHHLEGMRVVVRYRPPSNAGTTGDVVEFEVHDDPPVSANSPNVKTIPTAKP